MTEPARARVISPARRKQEHDRLARRATTASLSLAICLTGLFSALASIPRPAAGEGVKLTLQAGNGEAALTKALGDYRAAAAAHDSSTASAPTRTKALAPPRTTARPAANPPAAVSGGS